MSNTLELTPAELQIIKIQREKDALALAEAKTKNQLKIEKDILDCKAAVANHKKEIALQLEAAQTYCDELGKGWTLKITTTLAQKSVKDYHGPKDENDNYKVVYREEYEEKKAIIINGAFCVGVKEHITYRSQWDTRGTNNGWKMYLHGPGIDYKYESKAITKAATINKKVEEIVDEQLAKTNAAKKQVNVVKETLAKMTELYPDAEILYSKEWYRDQWQKQGSEIDVVKIKFSNGVSSKWNIYSDGSLGRLEVNFGSLTSWDTMQVLNSIA
jgi:hypothetical protein